MNARPVPASQYERLAGLSGPALEAALSEFDWRPTTTPDTPPNQPRAPKRTTGQRRAAGDAARQQLADSATHRWVTPEHAADYVRSSPGMNEDEWTKIVIDILLMRGWWAWHHARGRTSDGGHKTHLIGVKGGPDVRAVRAPGPFRVSILDLELKKVGGRLSDEQLSLHAQMPPDVDMYRFRVLDPTDIDELMEISA